MKALLYCTKGKKHQELNIDESTREWKIWYGSYGNVNGKIVAECEIETERIQAIECEGCKGVEFIYQTRTLSYNELLSKSCLNLSQFEDYLKCRNGYAIHISNLKIFDEPLDLGWFHKKGKNREITLEDGQKKTVTMMEPITKAPQNMCKAFSPYDEFVLISIRPEWICEILNGKKDIEVRSQVLNCMKGDML